MLSTQDAIRVEDNTTRDKRKIFVFVCKTKGCDTELRCREDNVEKASGFCTKHSHQKRPFEHIFKSIGKEGGYKCSSLSYEEFVDFTKVKQCYYCLSHISWQEFAYVDGEYTSRAYFLDRKINTQPYSKDNCVVCCTHCNRMKGNMDHNDFVAKCALIAENYMQRMWANLDGSSCGA
mgnify:CR=1 FL=1